MPGLGAWPSFRADWASKGEFAKMGGAVSAESIPWAIPFADAAVKYPGDLGIVQTTEVIICVPPPNGRGNTKNSSKRTLPGACGTRKRRNTLTWQLQEGWSFFGVSKTLGGRSFFKNEKA